MPTYQVAMQHEETMRGREPLGMKQGLQGPTGAGPEPEVGQANACTPQFAGKQFPEFEDYYRSVLKP